MATLDKQEHSWQHYLFFALSAICVALLIARAFFSIGWGDESYYIGGMYAIYQGQIPFVSSWDAHTGWCLQVPLLALYRLFSPDMTGILLYFRLTAIALLLLLAFVISRWVYKAYGGSPVFWFCLPYAFLIPYSIYTLSYNTMTVYLGTAAAFLLSTAAPEKRDRLRYFTGGVLMGMACICYPTWAVSSVLAVGWILWRNHGHRSWEKVLWYAAGGALTALLFVAWIVSSSSLEEFLQGLEGTLTAPYMQSRGISRWWIDHVFVAAAYFYLKRPFTLFILAYIAVLCILTVRKPQKALFYKSICLLVFLIGNTALHPDDLGYMSVGVWIAVVSFAVFTDLKTLWKRYSLPFLTAVAFVVTSGLTSYTGNGMLGFEVTGPLAFLLLGLVVHDTLPTAPSRKIAFLIALVLYASGTLHAYTRVFGDAPIPEETACVEIGAYKGIHTTPDKKDCVEKLQKIVSENIPADSTFCDVTTDMPVFLMIQAKIYTPIIWDIQMMDRGFTSAEPLLKYFEQKGRIPDILLTTNLGVADYFSNPDYEIKTFIADNYDMYFNENIGKVDGRDIIVRLWRNKSLDW